LDGSRGDCSGWKRKDLWRNDEADAYAACNACSLTHLLIQNPISLSGFGKAEGKSGRTRSDGILKDRNLERDEEVAGENIIIQVTQR
jgi:hypothetical protein